MCKYKAKEKQIERLKKINVFFEYKILGEREQLMMGKSKRGVNKKKSYNIFLWKKKNFWIFI